MHRVRQNLVIAIKGIFLVQGCVPVPFVRPVISKSSSTITVTDQQWSLSVPRTFSRRVGGAQKNLIVAESADMKVTFYAVRAESKSGNPSVFLEGTVRLHCNKMGWKILKEVSNPVITNRIDGVLFRAELERKDKSKLAVVALMSHHELSAGVVVIEVKNNDRESIVKAHETAKTLKYVPTEQS